MYYKTKLKPFVVFMIFIIPCFFSLKAETTTGTKITSLPTVINSPGVYYLARDHKVNLSSSTQYAIEIDASYVTIDLNGHTIANTNGPSTSAFGIYWDKRKAITIKNGTISGFSAAILNVDVPPYTATRGHLIAGIRFYKNYRWAILLRSAGCNIRNNLILDTGGNTDGHSSTAIHVEGSNNFITGNTINGLFENGSYSGTGIFIRGSGYVIENNRIFNLLNGPGDSYGILISMDSYRVFVVNNRISVMDYGIYYTSLSSGRYRDNIVVGCSTPYTGGTDIGNNN
jgi:hypothetical protein